MERLTQKFDSGAWGIRGSIDDAVLRLAAYEDSGLLPVEIYRLKREKDRAAAGMSREQVDVVIKSLKLRLENNEEGGVVYIPKFAVEGMIERLEAIYGQETE